MQSTSPGSRKRPASGPPDLYQVDECDVFNAVQNSYRSSKRLRQNSYSPTTVYPLLATAIPPPRKVPTRHLLPEEDLDFPPAKRMKLSEISCQQNTIEETIEPVVDANSCLKEAAEPVCTEEERTTGLVEKILKQGAPRVAVDLSLLNQFTNTERIAIAPIPREEYVAAMALFSSFLSVWQKHWLFTKALIECCRT